MIQPFTWLKDMNYLSKNIEVIVIIIIIITKLILNIILNIVIVIIVNIIIVTILNIYYISHESFLNIIYLISNLLIECQNFSCFLIIANTSNERVFSLFASQCTTFSFMEIFIICIVNN